MPGLKARAVSGCALTYFLGEPGQAETSSIICAGPVSRALIAQAGVADEWQEYLRQKKQSVLQIGQIATTLGGSLAFQYMFHVCVPPWRVCSPYFEVAALHTTHRGFNKIGQSVEPLESAIRQGLDAARACHITSIAIPALGVGPLGYPVAECTQAIARVVADFCGHHNKPGLPTPDGDEDVPLSEIQFVCTDHGVLEGISQALDGLIQTRPATGRSAVHATQPPEAQAVKPSAPPVKPAGPVAKPASAAASGRAPSSGGGPLKAAAPGKPPQRSARAPTQSGHAPRTGARPAGGPSAADVLRQADEMEALLARSLRLMGDPEPAPRQQPDEGPMMPPPTRPAHEGPGPAAEGPASAAAGGAPRGGAEVMEAEPIGGLEDDTAGGEAGEPSLVERELTAQEQDFVRELAQMEGAGPSQALRYFERLSDRVHGNPALLMALVHRGLARCVEGVLGRYGASPEMAPLAGCLGGLVGFLLGCESLIVRAQLAQSGLLGAIAGALAPFAGAPKVAIAICRNPAHPPIAPRPLGTTTYLSLSSICVMTSFPPSRMSLVVAAAAVQTLARLAAPLPGLATLLVQHTEDARQVRALERELGAQLGPEPEAAEEAPGAAREEERAAQQGRAVAATILRLLAGQAATAGGPEHDQVGPISAPRRGSSLDSLFPPGDDGWAASMNFTARMPHPAPGQVVWWLCEALAALGVLPEVHDLLAEAASLGVLVPLLGALVHRATQALAAQAAPQPAASAAAPEQTDSVAVAAGLSVRVGALGGACHLLAVAAGAQGASGALRGDALARVEGAGQAMEWLKAALQTALGPRPGPSQAPISFDLLRSPSISFNLRLFLGS
ncbi:hypothetical protein PAPYR_1238 [Paratrimastix pyriformis]|uniref:Macro domain-containing protein n=1 Tax=Paratrimastix pyriformis TaxID=342808 RepID=A0ABQ8UU59_9EUKA|nr:hypothetical protein PAPYR_1238 [Paratrimastix pyriformis]